MRVLVCGSRHWTDGDIIDVITSGLAAEFNGPDKLVLVHGAAPGADSLAADSAALDGTEILPFPADWKNDGRYAAGPKRNQRMLDEAFPQMVIAFKDGLRPALDKGGTEDMVRRAKAAGIPVYVVSHG